MCRSDDVSSAAKWQKHVTQVVLVVLLTDRQTAPHIKQPHKLASDYWITLVLTLKLDHLTRHYCFKYIVGTQHFTADMATIAKCSTKSKYSRA